MPHVSLNIPAIGEGLQEARVVKLLKQPGDRVKRDEPIYQMETDKAVMDVESSHDGIVVQWLAKEDDVLAIGAPILVLDSAEPGESPVATAPQVDEAPAVSDGAVALQIPAIGEGLQEARLVAKLKQVGELVKRDEAIYQMETDKAVMDVECPYEGVIVEWLAEVDAVLPIGADVVRIQTSDAVSAGAVTPVAASAPPAQASTPAAAPKLAPGERRRDIPPRTRAYAKQKGIPEDELAVIPAKGSKLMPEDIDAWVAGQSDEAPAAKKGDSGGRTYSEAPMASRQRVLSSRLVRGNQVVVPGMMSVVCDWRGVESLRAAYKAKGGDFQPSTFTMFAYAVALAAKNHPIVRSTMIGDSTVRTYDHLQLGIAVALPGDQLVVAVVENSDALDWESFAATTRERISLARDGQDQANESVTLSITNMQAYGIRDAMAVVVPPGVATIFLGEAHNALDQSSEEPRIIRAANVGITIDHRLINGVGGAEFLNAIRANVEGIQDLIKI